MTHLGTTSMSLEDLRDFSQSFNNMYMVHKNDYRNWAKVKAGCQLTLASVVLTRSPLTPLKFALAPLRVAAIHGGKHMLRGRVRPAVLTGVATLTAGTNTISE